jgi:hypothetical protein
MVVVAALRLERVLKLGAGDDVSGEEGKIVRRDVVDSPIGASVLASRRLLIVIVPGDYATAGQ